MSINKKDPTYYIDCAIAFLVLVMVFMTLLSLGFMVGLLISE